MREAAAGDIGFIASLFRLPHAREFLNEPGRAAIEAALEDPNVESYLIEEDGAPAGHFLLRNHEWLFDFGVLIARRPHRGLGTFALCWGISRAFHGCGAHRVFLEVREDNVRTRTLCERLGFVAEGLYRDGFRDARTGRYHNLVPYGLLRSDRPGDAHSNFLEVRA